MNASRLSAHWFPSDRWRVRCDHDHKYDNKEQKLEFPSCGDKIKPENFNPSEAEETHKHVMWSFLVTKLDNKRIEDLSLSLLVWVDGNRKAAQTTQRAQLCGKHHGSLSIIHTTAPLTELLHRGWILTSAAIFPFSFCVCCTVMMRLDEVFVLKSDTVCGTEA